MGSPFQYGQQYAQGQMPQQQLPSISNPGNVNLGFNPLPPQPFQAQQQNGGDQTPPLAKPSPERPLGFPTAGAGSPVPYGQFKGAFPYSPGNRMY